jgi:pimeloyl-ACP methyl ester carboxylesterase
MLVEKSFDAGEVVINYAEGPPNGPAILFIHGITGNWRGFLPIMPSLTMRWQVFAVDLRGHGKSGHKSGRYTLQDYTRDLRTFIRNVIHRPVILFGHSLGGMIATILAADNPDVEAVVIGDSPPNYDGGLRDDMLSKVSYWSQAKKTAETGNTVTEIMKTLREKRVMWGDVLIEDSISLLNMAINWSRMDPDILTNMIECKDDPTKFTAMADGYDTEKLFPRIKCPVLLLRGNPELGGTISVEELEKAKALVPHLTCVRFDSIGHALFPRGPEPVLTSLTIFLESLR